MIYNNLSTIELTREGSVIEINNDFEESKAQDLHMLSSQIFRDDPNEIFLDENSDKIPITIRSDWFSNFSTNVRYQISEVPIMPIFGYEKVDFSLGSSPVIMLSKIYEIKDELPENVQYEFSQDFRKLIWVTYRYGYKPLERIEGENIIAYSSDTGWGCTVRVGQMLLMRTLQLHFYTESYECYQLLQLIQENLLEAPYSIQQIAVVGAELGKKPGDWYSPSTMCHAIDKLLNLHPIPKLKTKIFMETIIYKDQLYSAAGDININDFLSNCEFCKNIEDFYCDKCREKLNDIEWKNSMLVMIPLMLGLGSIHQEYYETLKFFLNIPQTVGIIGGKPKSALYIVGYQNDSLLFLDPHLAQQACTSDQDLLNKIETYHCSSYKLIPMSSAESSISLGYYFRNKESFLDFERIINENRDMIKGLIGVQEFTPQYIMEEFEVPDIKTSDSDEEYVVL